MRLQRNSLLLFLFVVFLCCASVSFSLEILSDLNQTIVSRGNIFELGLFQPDKYTRSWYIGIWYKEDPKRTVLWVANRNHPLFESNFSLRLTDNNLILYNHLNLPIWSTNLIGGDGSSSQPMVVELLDSGNLVLKNTNKKDSYSILWQSFDFPTDTLLPEMTLGMNPKTGADIFLQSWISSDNPASGVRIMEIVNRGGLFQIFVNYVEYGFNVYAHRRDPWNGIQFGDMPQVFEWDKVSLTFVMSYGRNYSRLTLTPGGNYNLYKWVQEKKEWELSWSTERDVCSGYPCGSNAYCLENKSLLTCLCIEGFIPLSTLPWAAGNKFSCRRKTKLNCRGDEFLMLKNMRIPDTTGVTVDMKINSKECLRMCQGDCYCTAFAYVGIGQRGCVIWTRELTDIRNYSVGGQDLYVRLASNETGDTKETRLEERYITLIIVGGIAAFILGCFCLWKRMKRGSSHSQEPTETEIMMTELSREVFSFIALRTVAAATDNFSVSNELGRGGFGVVYKGILDDGTIVAVKRLSRTSLQGTIEFRNEVRTVLNVLHINLVRLLSCCCEGTERILVYEYMENLSLNRFLFRGALSRSLSWEQKFRIMGEIAQGLSYLHNSRDSPILHRDLKPSNILLDSNMTAKISDFGMAKFLESGQTEAQTQRVVGSYGYMSEEYAVSRIIIVFR
ncbi:receptor-like serine/threonine-protein kinase SD1-8 [Raphanus sativus]|uniref:non-specific serine/threonine protein kinase n=1 Tax=Raphanus sativus TaxID=3726 RepID=A0A9W3CBT7_RAPSA|nr:receptor-like serine/threonine-protein kinase SD1-8 [Raphanus sativus]